jgi:hypothetical protein
MCDGFLQVIVTGTDYKRTPICITQSQPEFDIEGHLLPVRGIFDDDRQPLECDSHPKNSAKENWRCLII